MVLYGGSCRVCHLRNIHIEIGVCLAYHRSKESIDCSGPEIFKRGIKSAKYTQGHSDIP